MLTVGVVIAIVVVLAVLTLIMVALKSASAIGDIDGDTYPFAGYN